MDANERVMKSNKKKSNQKKVIINDQSELHALHNGAHMQIFLLMFIDNDDESLFFGLI